MKKSWVIASVIVLLTACCTASIGLGFFFLNRIPPVETQLYKGSTPVHVQLSAPSSPTGWPLNAYIPVQAEAYGGGTISSIELYINGQLYQTVNTPAGWNQPEYAASWYWQPGTTGTFILLSKATNTMGATGISDPIRLEVIDAAGTISPYLAKEGETLETIAGTEQVDIADLAKANPSLEDPSQIIPVDTRIDLPNPPAPVTNPNIISGFEILGLEELPQVDPNTLPEPGSEESNPPPTPPQGFHLPSFQDLQFWIDETYPGKEVSLPLEPVISAGLISCDVKIWLKNGADYDVSYDPSLDDTSKNESGFFIYRSQDGKPFERIATLPPIGDSEMTWQYQQGYPLQSQYGVVTYAMSAFNAAGETMSAPATLPLDQFQCTSPGRGVKNNISIEDGNLILPYSMDLAYLYLSINDSRSIRIPEGDRMFLPASGIKLNLYDYFDTMLGSFTAADFDISMEVWGWIGSELKFVGTYETTIHRSVLLVCSEEGEGKCSGNGDGEWLTEINFSDQKPIKDQVYEFKWISSQITKTDRVCYQFAASPYTDDSLFNLKNPISSSCGYIIKNNQYSKSNEETFTQSMGSLLYPTEPPEYLGWGNNEEINDYNSVWFQKDYPEGSSFTIYARVLPKAEKYDDFARFSNTVILHRSTPPIADQLPPLASTLPSLYDIQILRESYVPPEFEVWENWGCVIIDEDPTGEFYPGQFVCPGKMKPKDPCEGKFELICLIEGFGDSLGFLYDQFSLAYKLYKAELAKGLTSLIPGCEAKDWCSNAIKKGVDYGASYLTGLPPTMPNSEELIGDSVGEMFVNAAEAAEKYFTGMDDFAIKEFCESTDCKKVISDYVTNELKKAKSYQAQKSCSGGMEAYYHGQLPNCLDPSISVHAAPGSGNYPAVIAIKITRKADGGIESVPPDFAQYRLAVNVNASNDLSQFGISQTEFKEYGSVLLEIPNLSPGGSTTIYVPLKPCPDYNQDNNTCGEYEDYEGMKVLYYNGVTKMKAFEACYSTGSSWEWVPCADGGYDSWTFDNPTNELVPLP